MPLSGSSKANGLVNRLRGMPTVTRIEDHLGPNPNLQTRPAKQSS
jgi:hypothetical protein